jgi:predicted benzoate:H+ symporter BenE
VSLSVTSPTLLDRAIGVVGPEALGAIVGQVIDGVRRLRAEGYEDGIGIVIETGAKAVAIADVGDGLAIGAWPDPARWSAVGSNSTNCKRSTTPHLD